MKHWTIYIPGWGTVYGRGTREQADEVVHLRYRRGEAQVIEVAEPDPRINWDDLSATLVKLRRTP